MYALFYRTPTRRNRGKMFKIELTADPLNITRIKRH